MSEHTVTVTLESLSQLEAEIRDSKDDAMNLKSIMSDRDRFSEANDRLINDVNSLEREIRSLHKQIDMRDEEALKKESEEK